jgi:hypothetical protein
MTAHQNFLKRVAQLLLLFFAELFRLKDDGESLECAG